MPMNLQDAALTVSVALPAASGTAHTPGIDLQVNANALVGITNTSDFVAPCEFILSVPSLTSTQLPSSDTFTYSIEHSSASNFGSPVTLFTFPVQTGTGSTMPALSTRFRLPENVSRYVRATCVSSSGTAATAASMTLTPVF